MQQGNLYVALLQDTKTVYCLSSNMSPAEVTVHRCQKIGSRVEVPCPLAIRIYNEFMAGVDKND